VLEGDVDDFVRGGSRKHIFLIQELPVNF